ncbi:MAG TPA: DUF2249 domain-containing protein [Opitutaceae bacterium]|nr:DUF2249 domain-containing protein [Opitutaceae bacterium]
MPSHVAPKFRTLDVRELIARGEEPYPQIMAAVEALAPDEGLAVLAPFLPTPLIELLKSAGFSARPERRNDGSWQTFFRRD